MSQHNLVAGSHTLGTNDPEFIFPAAGTRQEVTITVLPMYHIYGLNVTMTSALHFGVKQVAVNKLTRSARKSFAMLVIK